MNEPAPGKKRSQVDEYLDFYNGPGVQHIAIATDDIIASVAAHRGREASSSCGRPTAILRAGFRERLETSLIDFDDLARPPASWLTGTRTAICCRSSPSMNQDRPTVFFELIERHGSQGFGNGNFKALFVALEREQARRGNL